MIIGNDWLGSYSRFSFDETKKYLYMLKEKGKYILDDEFNLLQEMQMTYVRRFMNRVFGNGSPDTGFKVVGTGASNDFTITAGNLIIDGWLVNLASNCLYSTQHNVQPTPAPPAPTALTTPGAGRVDVVYLQTWFEEVDSLEDSNIKDPTLQTQTSCRLQQKWAVKVVEGGAMPAVHEIVGNKEYWRYQIATLNRLSGDATITVGMVVDERDDLAYSNRLKLTGDEMTGPLKLAKGADVVSEAALFTTAGFPTDGNYFDITGTTGITSILTSGKIGTVIQLHFDGVVILTHSAGLSLPGSQNVTTAAGDELTFIEYESGWRLCGWTRPTYFNSPVIVTPTIVTPTIASFVNAEHNHSNAAGGGVLGAAAISSVFGAYSSPISEDVVWQATADGIIIAINTSSSGVLTCKSDGANPPTTLVGTADSGTEGSAETLVFPCRKGHYVLITNSTANSPTIYFIPLGV